MPAAGGEAGDAGRGHQTAGHGEPELLGLGVQVLPGAAGLRGHPPAAGVDLDALHQREVQHDAVVDGGEAGDRVAAAADGQRQSLAAGEVDRADHVGDPGAPGDHRRTAVVGAVPDAAVAVVVRVPRPDGRAAQAGGEFGDGGLPDAGRPGFVMVMRSSWLFVDVQERR